MLFYLSIATQTQCVLTHQISVPSPVPATSALSSLSYLDAVRQGTAADAPQERDPRTTPHRPGSRDPEEDLGVQRQDQMRRTHLTVEPSDAVFCVRSCQYNTTYRTATLLVQKETASCVFNVLRSDV